MLVSLRRAIARNAHRAAPGIPAFAGMALVSIGAALIFFPAGLVVAGLLCLAIDARL